MTQYVSTSPREDQLGKSIVHAAYTVHKTLGSGLLESIYETCFCHELTKQGIKYQRQVILPIIYDGLQFDDGLRLDVLVGDLVVCELKAVEEMNPIFTAQLMSYLKLSNRRLGFLINFNVAVIKNGIKRIVI